MIKVKVNNEYKDVVKIFCGGTLQKEIVKVWSREAQEYVYESSVEYTGSLPITINADGNALLDYRIYGASGGVGEPTENLFDGQGTDNYGYYEGVSGQYINDQNYKHWRFPVKEGDIIRWTKPGAGYGCYLSNGIRKGIIVTNSTPFTVPADVDEVTNNFNSSVWDSAMVTKNQPLPPTYIPYGYKLPMVVADGELRKDIEQGGWNGRDGIIVSPYNTGDFAPIRCRVSKVYVNGTKTYTISAVPNYLEISVKAVRASNVQVSDSGWVKSYTITPTTLTSYLAIIIRKPDNSNITPADVQCVKIITSEATTTPVYIGDTPLEEDEYVSFSEQKIYRDISGTLTPTDPPVPLPEIPTIDGTTVIDYDGDPKPSQMYIKYRR